MTSFRRYEIPLARIIVMRMTKIQTRSFTWSSGLGTASKMNEIRATPVTP
jgi:hypothetical protein